MTSDSGHRLVFVGGLHRSGTSLIARWLGAHPQVSAFANTRVPEDEGQHLQDVYPRAGDLGGAGRFAFAAQSHRTEESPLVTPASRQRLLDSWSRHWDLSKPVLLEKSPPNLLASRWLHALFPTSRFVMVVRHPIAVSLATRPWQDAPKDLELLVRHWITAHEMLMHDAAVVRDLAIVRYEDVMSSPALQLRSLFAFIGLPPHEESYVVRAGLNERYFAEWRAPWRLLRRRAIRRIADAYEARVTPFGYSLREPERVTVPAEAVRALSPEAQMREPMSRSASR
jgi:Sulfotransferase family